MCHFFCMRFIKEKQSCFKLLSEMIRRSAYCALLLIASNANFIIFSTYILKIAIQKIGEERGTQSICYSYPTYLQCFTLKNQKLGLFLAKDSQVYSSPFHCTMQSFFLLFNQKEWKSAQTCRITD
jgi:hypothetical protein